MAIKASTSITVAIERDISSVTRFYKIQSSTSTPTQPSGTGNPSGWSTSEPEYDGTSTNSLYICDRTIFTDGTASWSPVSKSSSYEASKQAYNKAQSAYDATQPIDTRTYTGVIGTANNADNASFYFAKVHPTSFTSAWMVKLHMEVSAPTNYEQIIDIEIRGDRDVFRSYDSLVSLAGNRALYYMNLYRAKQAGITNGKGHALGFGLRESTNPANASYARTIRVDVIAVENCTVAMMDTAVKYASMDGTGSTNYAGLTELSIASNGQNATNNYNTNYTAYGGYIKAGVNGIRGYSLVMKDSDDTWSCFYSNAYKGTATDKTVYTGGFKLGKIIYNTGSGAQTSNSSLDTYYNYKEGVNAATPYDSYTLDLRYSTNCGTTLTAYKPVYLVGTIGNDGLFYLDSTWWTQTIPTSEDGKTYVYIGDSYSTYQCYLSVENPAYQFYDGKFRKLSEVEELRAQETASIAYDIASEPRTIKYAYATTTSGDDFSLTDTSLQYRGIYSGVADEELYNDPSNYIWELNPVWASKYADQYLHNFEGGLAIYNSDLGSDTYAGLSATALTFFLSNIEQLRVGYDASIDEYGVISSSIIASGSGAGVKFDNYGHTDEGARGRFIWEVRDNGHLSLKLF